MEEFSERINRLAEGLIQTAGQDPVADAKTAGIILAYRDLVDSNYGDF
jgi:hypothetical protein